MRQVYFTFLVALFAGSCLPRPRTTECAPCSSSSECGVGFACTSQVCVRTDGVKSACAEVDCKACTDSTQCPQSQSCIRGKCIANDKALSSCLSFEQMLCEACQTSERCGEGFACERGVCIASGLPLGRCLAPGAVNCSDCRSIACGYAFQCVEGLCTDPKLTACVSGEKPKLCAACDGATSCESGSNCKSGRCITAGKALTECFTFPDGVRCLPCGSDAECGDASVCRKSRCVPQGTALSECFSAADVACEQCIEATDCDKTGAFRCIKGKCVGATAPYSQCLAPDDVKCLTCGAGSECGPNYQCGQAKCQAQSAGLLACFSAAELECKSCAGGLTCGSGFTCRGTPSNPTPSICMADGQSLRRCVSSTGFVSGAPVRLSRSSPTVLIGTAYDLGGLDVGYFSPWRGNQTKPLSPEMPPLVRENDKVTIYGSIDENGNGLDTLLTHDTEWFQYSVSAPAGTYRIEFETNNYYSNASGSTRVFDVFFSDGSLPATELKLTRPVIPASMDPGDFKWTTNSVTFSVGSDSPKAKVRITTLPNGQPATNDNGGLNVRRIRLVPM
jgi:hypothetical protein